MKSTLMKTTLWTATMLAGCVGALGMPRDARHGPLFTEYSDPSYRFSFTALGEADVAGVGATALYETGLDWRIFWIGDEVAEAEALGGVHLGLFSDRTEYDLPASIMAAFVETRGTLRLEDGWAVALSLRPEAAGEVGELGHGIGLPVSAAVANDIADDLTLGFGLTYRMNYDTMLRPFLKAHWNPSPEFELEAGYPETRATWYVLRDLRFRAGIEWLDQTYKVEDIGETNDNRMTLRETRIMIETEIQVTPELALRLGVGRTAGRDILFDERPADWPSELNVEDASLIAISLLGPF